MYYLTVQSELSNARRDAEQAKLAQVELKSLTDQLEEQRQLTSKAEQALASAKVYSFSTACAHCSTYSCRHLRNGCPHKFTVGLLAQGCLQCNMPQPPGTCMHSAACTQVAVCE